MNNGFPSSAAAMNGREPFASTPAGSTLVTGRPAEPSAAAIPFGPRRRSGTPNRTSTAAPAVTPAANATTASTGEAVPVTSRTTAASHKVIQAMRRHGRLSHGAAATVTATAAARSAGLTSDPSVSHDHWPAPIARSRGRCPPARSMIPITTALAKTAAPARPASSRNRR